ncbi:MAG TPA: HPF/RaiA family ribosome-associated protein [Magnetospirillaceae bacterium]
MDVPLQIAFHGIDHSDAVESSIRSAVDKLEKLNGGITGCRVAVESRNHEAETRRASVRVRIDLTVPGTELVVTEEPKNGNSHDLPGAVRRAFQTMERQLKDRRDRRHSR